MLIKIILLSFVCSLISVILKSVKPEYSLLTGIVFGVVFVYIISEPLSDIFVELNLFSQYIKGGEDVLKRVFRIITVAYATEIAAEISRSAGEGAIAKKVEIAGRIYAAQIVLPVFSLLMDVIKNVL